MLMTVRVPVPCQRLHALCFVRRDNQATASVGSPCDMHISTVGKYVNRVLWLFGASLRVPGGRSADWWAVEGWGQVAHDQQPTQCARRNVRFSANGVTVTPL